MRSECKSQQPESYNQVRLLRTRFLRYTYAMGNATCSVCKKRFVRPLARVREAKKHGWKQFCSSSCLSNFRKRGEQLACANPSCSKSFYRRRSEILKVNLHYCSQSCAGQINNQNFPKRIKITKICELRGCKNQAVVAQKFCSRPCYGLARTGILPAQLIKKLQAAVRRLGRTPARREMTEIAEKCVWAFGSWNGALVAAGLEPHRSHSARMYKRTRTVASDGHRCDSISEALVDNWLTEHSIKHTRDAPYPETHSKSDWKLEGKVFVEYFGLANDSARYDRAIKQKRALCKKHGITLVELYSSDLYPTLNLAPKLAKYYSVSA